MPYFLILVALFAIWGVYKLMGDEDDWIRWVLYFALALFVLYCVLWAAGKVGNPLS